MGILMPVTGKLFDRFGANWLAIIGLLILIATTISLTNLTDSTGYLYMALMATGRRIGLAMILMPIQTAGLKQYQESYARYCGHRRNTGTYAYGGYYPWHQ